MATTTMIKVNSRQTRIIPASAPSESLVGGMVGGVVGGVVTGIAGTELASTVGVAVKVVLPGQTGNRTCTGLVYLC